MPEDIIIGRDESDKKRFGNEGLVYLGKHYVKMGSITSLSNRIMLDVARAHVVLVAGKRGCLEGETMVFTNSGYKKIKDFDEKKDKVLSFDKANKKFEWENAKLLRYPVKNEKLLKIEFEDGRSLVLTREHPLLMNYGKYLFWRQAKDFKINDKMVLPTTLPEIKNSESEEMARILGFVLSDGTMNKRKGKWKDGRGYWYNGTKSRLRIFCDDEFVLKTAKKDLEKEFGLYVKEYKRNDCNCSVIQSLHAKVVDKINKLGVPLGNKSGIIRVPEIVWKSSNKFKSNFISALFSCDGYINKTGRYIDYASKSKRFLEDLQILLTHFNIESAIRKKNAKLNGKVYENYRLFITDNVSVENFKKIGFISKFKQDRLEKHKFNNTKKRKTHYIPSNLVCRKIKKIEELSDIIEVYDLSVDKNHSFIANGIISHNSGKSYTLGTIAEEIATLPPEVAQNIAVLLFDTMGIFWTMKYKNDKEMDLLREWGLETRKIPVKVFVPFGKIKEYDNKGIPYDQEFSLSVPELSADDWVITFGLDYINPVAIVIERNITMLQEEFEAGTIKNFDIDDIILAFKKDKDSGKDAKEAAINFFEGAKTWGLFSSKKQKGTKVEELVEAGKTTVLDVSCYSSIGTFNIRSLVIGLLSKKLFNERMDARKKEEVEAVRHGIDYLYYKEKREMPLVWLAIDEAHEFLPLQGKTSATDALIQLLREGRQPGISLLLATQQPGMIHRDVLTQSDVVIAHRVTAKPDIDALNYIMQTYLLADIKTYLDNLPRLKGSAIILDDNSERIYPMRVRPRFTWHGGEAPTAIKVKKRV